MKICKLEYCNKPHKAYGFCNKHYRRYKVHGDPNKVLIDHSMEPGASAFTSLFHIYKVRARVKKMSFTLSKQEFKTLTKSNCFYCNQVPAQELKKQKGSYIYNGIDRVDSNEGYDLKNCVPACWKCNFMKSDTDLNEFRNQLIKIFSYWINK